MSSKHEAARQQIAKHLERGNDKDAYKQAKALYRLDTSPESRELLERAYLLRIQALLTAGMAATAKETAEAFLAFGVKNDAVLASLLPLLSQAGLGEQAVALSARVGNPEAQSQLVFTMCDHAVRKPEAAAGLAAEYREGAGKVREALAATLAGDEAKATELLAGVPRQSPLADWKLFARGLGAHLRGEIAAADANWSRLQAGRAPHAIARTLASRRAGLVASPDATTSAAPRIDPNLEKLERQVFGEPVTAHLAAVETALDQQDLPHFLRALKQANSALRRTELDLGARLTACVLERFVAWATTLEPKAGQRAVEDFTRMAEPLPLDPRWNRLWALVWTRVGDPEKAGLTFWRAYLRDLDQIPFESPERRDVAKALVLERIGSIYANSLHDDAFSESLGLHVDEMETDEYRQYETGQLTAASEAYEASLKLRPRNKAIYVRLIEMFAESERWNEATAMANRAIDAMPDDLDVVVAALPVGAAIDDSKLMLRAAAQLRRLKPLDARHALWERLARFAAARKLAAQKQVEAARQELAQVEVYCDSPELRCMWMALRAAVEYRQHHDDLGSAFLTQGQAISHPVVFWFAFCQEAANLNLSRVIRQIGRSTLDKELKKKKVGSVAASLARVALEYDEFGRASKQNEELVELAVAYVGKASKATFTEPEIEQVLRLLGEKVEHEKSVLQLSKRAVKLFPDSAMCQYFLGVSLTAQELGKPYDVTGRARRHLELAAQLAARPGDRHASYLPRIRESLQFANTAFQMKKDAFFGGPRRSSADLPSFFDFFQS